jgi:hypothetical protein
LSIKSLETHTAASYTAGETQTLAEQEVLVVTAFAAQPVPTKAVAQVKVEGNVQAVAATTHAD